MQKEERKRNGWKKRYNEIEDVGCTSGDGVKKQEKREGLLYARVEVALCTVCFCCPFIFPSRVPTCTLSSSTQLKLNHLQV